MTQDFTAGAAEPVKGRMDGIKHAWGKPKAKKGMILFGAIGLVFIVATYLMFSRDASKPAGPPATVKVIAPPTGTDDVTGKTQENYKDLVRQADDERAAAARSGSATAMVLPRVTGMSDPDQLRKEEAQRLAADAEARGKQRAQAQAAAQAPVHTSAQAAGQAPADPNQGVRQGEAYRASMTLMQRVLTQSTAAQGPFATLSPLTNDKEGPRVTKDGISAPVSSMNTTNQAAQAAAAKGPPLMRAGEIVYAVMDIAMNSDYTGPIVATIRGGKFNGARAMGQKQLERDALVVRFNSLSPADGSGAYPIQAYAVQLGDAKDFGITAVKGETDYHVFQRYVLPAAASFVQAFGLSASQKGTTAVVTDGGVGTTTPALTQNDRYAVALGNSMTPLVNDLRTAGQRPITVSTAAGAEIGIIFAADVFNPATQRADAAAAAQRITAPVTATSSGPNTSVEALQQEAAAASARSNAINAEAMQQYRALSGGGAYTPYGGGGFGAPSYMQPNLGSSAFGSSLYQTPGYYR